VERAGTEDKESDTPPAESGRPIMLYGSCGCYVLCIAVGRAEFTAVIIKVGRQWYGRWFVIWLIRVISGQVVNHHVISGQLINRHVIRGQLINCHVISGQQLLHHVSECVLKTPYFSYSV